MTQQHKPDPAWAPTEPAPLDALPPATPQAQPKLPVGQARVLSKRELERLWPEALQKGEGEG